MFIVKMFQNLFIHAHSYYGFVLQMRLLKTNWQLNARFCSFCRHLPVHHACLSVMPVDDAFDLYYEYNYNSASAFVWKKTTKQYVHAGYEYHKIQDVYIWSKGGTQQVVALPFKGRSNHKNNNKLTYYYKCFCFRM